MMCVGLRRCVVRPSGVSCANVFSRVRGPRTVVELEGDRHYRWRACADFVGSVRGFCEHNTRFHAARRMNTTGVLPYEVVHSMMKRDSAQAGLLGGKI